MLGVGAMIVLLLVFLLLFLLFMPIPLKLYIKYLDDFNVKLFCKKVKKILKKDLIFKLNCIIIDLKLI